jgi:hypothetical protein
MDDAIYPIAEDNWKTWSTHTSATMNNTPFLFFYPRLVQENVWQEIPDPA